MNSARGRAQGGEGLRQETGEFSIWRLDVTNPARPALAPIVISDASLQSPILTAPLAGGVRYLAYASDESGSWGIYIQKLTSSFAPDGAPQLVVAPGTSQNFDCTRNLFHPAWVPGSTPGDLKLLVTMTDCPDNAFEDFGIDDDPWSQGELNVWQVSVPF
jgi:hypothetical protein